MPGLSFYDKQHIQKVAAQQGVINNIFNQFILSVSPYLRKWSDTGKNNVWIQNHSVEKAVDKELLTLQSLLLNNIESFQLDAWKRSDMKNDDFIREYIKGMAISSAVKEGMFTQSMSAFSAFQKDVDAQGIRLSDRVWNITQQTKSQLEFYLNSGIATGRSSNEISRDMRQLLDKPDKRFRRVRNDEGKLVLSRPMKDYHPGQGVYRSAKMNALRTSATTTNAAYRTADYERWSNQDFVLGIEIHRSANNRGPCKICDAMVGRYPKTFKFTGFHPFCICFATPITMEPDDFADFLVDDTIPQKQVITDIPQSAKDFVSENKDGLQSAFWYKDNFTKDGKFQKTIIPKQNLEVIPSSVKSRKSVQEAASIRHAKRDENAIRRAAFNRSLLQYEDVDIAKLRRDAKRWKADISEFEDYIRTYNFKVSFGLITDKERKLLASEFGKAQTSINKRIDIQKKWNERKLYNKIANTENEIRMNKKFETGVVFDKDGNVILDKRGASYSVGFTNEECAMMKDCIFTHNHPRGWGYPEKSLGRIGNSFSPEDIFLAIVHDIAEMRAVTPNYTFVMKRPEVGWEIDIKKIEKLVNQENNKLRREFTTRINNNTLSPSMASAVHYHILWRRVAEKMGWSYSKAKTR